MTAAEIIALKLPLPALRAAVAFNRVSLNDLYAAAPNREVVQQWYIGVWKPGMNAGELFEVRCERHLESFLHVIVAGYATAEAAHG
jgi:hypothetical protein